MTSFYVRTRSLSAIDKFSSSTWGKALRLQWKYFRILTNSNQNKLNLTGPYQNQNLTGAFTGHLTQPDVPPCQMPNSEVTNFVPRFLYQERFTGRRTATTTTNTIDL